MFGRIFIRGSGSTVNKAWFSIKYDQVNGRGMRKLKREVIIPR